MARPRSESADVSKFSIQCACGKRLVVTAEHAGKRANCPSCGHSLLLRPLPATPSPDHSRPSESEADGLDKRLVIGLASGAGAFCLACVVFLVWYWSHSADLAKVQAANKRLTQAIASANDWLADKNGNDGEAVRKALSKSLDSKLITDGADGRKVLTLVDQKREQIAAEARGQEGRRNAVAMLADATRLIDDSQITKAIELLRRYVSDPHASEKAAAQKLLVEAEAAASDKHVLAALVALSDDEFRRVEATGVIQAASVKHPALVKALAEAVKRNISEAKQQRIKLRPQAAEFAGLMFGSSVQDVLKAYGNPQMTEVRKGPLDAKYPYVDKRYQIAGNPQLPGAKETRLRLTHDGKLFEVTVCFETDLQKSYAIQLMLDSKYGSHVEIPYQVTTFGQSYTNYRYEWNGHPQMKISFQGGDVCAIHRALKNQADQKNMSLEESGVEKARKSIGGEF